MKGKRSERRISGNGLVAAALALATGLAPVCPASADGPATKLAGTEASATSTKAENADDASGTDVPEAPKSAGEAGQPHPGSGVSPDRVRTALAEAESRRQALLRPDTQPADQDTHTALAERWGLEVLGVRLTARGYMIDFRFRVLDLNKALPLFDPREKPYLLAEDSAIRLPVPTGQKVGAFRTTNRGRNIQAGKDYYMLFANPDAFVKAGARVTVAIGDFRAEHMTLR